MHYGIGVVPARPYKPRDKAKVESGAAARALLTGVCRCKNIENILRNSLDREPLDLPQKASTPSNIGGTGYFDGGQSC